MAKKESKKYKLQINDLKVLSFKIEDEPTEYEVGKLFTFNINVGHLVERENQTVQVIVNVSVFEPDKPTVILSTIQVAAVYHLPDFNVIITEETLDIDDDLRTLIHGITISTTRGILYSSLRGTYLEKAIIPIINPQTMVLATGE